MEISEVVRGEDLLISTARQILIYEALGATPPQFYHAPLVIDSEGDRLAKTHQSMSLRELKQAGHSPEDLRKSEAWWSGIEDSLNLNIRKTNRVAHWVQAIESETKFFAFSPSHLYF